MAIENPRAREFVLTPQRTFASVDELRNSLRKITDLKATIASISDFDESYVVSVRWSDTLRGLRNLPDWKVSLPNVGSASEATPAL